MSLDMRNKRLLCCLLVLLSASGFSKEAEHVLVWPPQGTTLVRFTVGAFQRVSQYAGTNSYVAEVVVENVWSKPIRNASFVFHLYDKDKVRIGDGYISISELNPGERAKLPLTTNSLGTPVLIEVAPQVVPPEFGPAKPPRTISMRIFSVPPGAFLKVDGSDFGTTPRSVNFAVGHHVLEFGREGFANGRYELDVDPDEVSGGALTLELGGSNRDVIELRDGTVLTGDLESISATEVVVRVGGEDRKIERNKVKKILLVERQPVPSAVAKPTPQQ